MAKAKKKEPKLSPFARLRAELQRERELTLRLTEECKLLRGTNDFLNKRFNAELKRNDVLLDELHESRVANKGLIEALQQARGIIAQTEQRDKILVSRFAGERLQILSRLAELERLGGALGHDIATPAALEVPKPKDAGIAPVMQGCVTFPAHGVGKRWSAARTAEAFRTQGFTVHHHGPEDTTYTVHGANRCDGPAQDTDAVAKKLAQAGN